MNAHSGRAGKVRIVATFGDSQLVRRPNGRYDLCGGSVADDTDAMEWISIFHHEAVVSFPPPVHDAAFCEPARNVSQLNIRHSARAAAACDESRKPWVTFFGNEDLNGRLPNRKPLQD
jgi:hypothetical protein